MNLQVKKITNQKPCIDRVISLGRKQAYSIEDVGCKSNIPSLFIGDQTVQFSL